MTHTNMEELLSAHANGELSRTQREFVEEHLGSCADCRALLVSHVWVRSRLTSLKSTPLETDITLATMSRIRKEATTRWSARRLPRPALVVAAVVAAVVVPLVLQLLGTDPGTRIAEAHSMFAELQSYRMTGSTASTVNQTTSEVSFDWAFVAPDRYRGTLIDDSEEWEFIIIGEEQYVRTPDGDQAGGTVVVITTGGFSIFNPIPSRDGTLEILDSLIEVSVLQDQEVDGVDSLHYRGRVDMNRVVDEVVAGLNPSSPGYLEATEVSNMQRTAEVDVNLWIGKEDSSMRKLELDVRAPATVSGPKGGRQIIWMKYLTEARFFDFNESIEIHRPVAVSGEPEPGWYLATIGSPAPTVVTSEAE